MPTKSKSDFGKGVLYYPVRQMGKAAADTYAPVPTWDSTAGMSGNEIPTWDGTAGVSGDEIPTWDGTAGVSGNEIPTWDGAAGCPGMKSQLGTRTQLKKRPVYRAFPLNTIVFTINFTENLT